MDGSIFTELDALIKWIPQTFSGKLGLLFGMTKVALRFLLPSESHRTNTINGVIKFIEYVSHGHA